jgi:putative SOS response-associated peptidase YedK
MCGRFTLTDPDPRLLRIRFKVDESVEVPELERRYNIAPTDPVFAVRERDRSRDLGLLRWGLVPYWAGGNWKGPPMINARDDRLDEVPVFEEAFAERRCLIPADGFYEWRKTDAGKQPVRLSRPDGSLFAFAGLWASSKRDDGTKLFSCTIVTCDPNDVVQPIHDRMPVILPEEGEELWLSPDADPDQLRALLNPDTAGELAVREVSEAVNDVREDGPHLLEPPLKLL